jgi:hypothetical protein
VSLWAFDPGADTGWSRFDGGYLRACGLIHPGRFHQFSPSVVYQDDTAIIERPTHYPGTDANDLIILAERAGQLQGWCDARGIKWEMVEPRTWKGSVPKPIHNKRVEAKLTQGELYLLDHCGCAKRQRNNVVDAIGLGLWKIRR